jgi:multidrug transporter EmrE-like cation transporter
MHKLINHWSLIIAIIFAGLTQIILRWQMGKFGSLPELLWDKVLFFCRFFLTPWVWVAIFCTGISAISWIITISKFELSYAYPWTAILYIYLLLAGIFLFNDSISFNKVLGTIIIMVGVIFIAK